jgi:ADP-heptose:LPS heptosyltransferase
VSPPVDFSEGKTKLKAESLRLNPDRPYAFKSSWKTAFVRTADKIGGWLFRSPQAPIDWRSVKKIAVFRLDQLGDVLLALPALEALSRGLPGAQIDFFIEPGAKEMVELADLKINLRPLLAPWLAKPGFRSGTRKALGKLTGLLREGNYDAAIDLRGDLHHILAMKCSAVPIRIGRTLTGGGFWLTHPVARCPGLHEVEQNLDLLEKTGIPVSQEIRFPKLFPGGEDHLKQISVRGSLNLTRPIVAIHAVCAATAKRWPVSYWRQLIAKLPPDIDVVMVGSEKEKVEIAEIAKDCPREVSVAAGLFQLRELAAFLKQCKLFVGVDSGPAHIAAAVGTPVVSIFSGTNSAAQWAPHGPQVSLLQKQTPCSPCERTECPFNNECMRQIGVEEVLGLVNKNLTKSF